MNTPFQLPTSGHGSPLRIRAHSQQCQVRVGGLYTPLRILWRTLSHAPHDVFPCFPDKSTKAGFKYSKVFYRDSNLGPYAWTFYSLFSERQNGSIKMREASQSRYSVCDI